VVIGKKIPAVGFVDRESKCDTKFYHAARNSKPDETVLILPAAGIAASLNGAVVKFIPHLLRAGRVVSVGTIQRG